MKDSTIPYGRYVTEQEWFKVIDTPKNGRVYTKSLVTPKRASCVREEDTGVRSYVIFR